MGKNTMKRLGGRIGWKGIVHEDVSHLAQLSRWDGQARLEERDGRADEGFIRCEARRHPARTKRQDKKY